MTVDRLLQQGIAALKAGQMAEARNLLTQVIQEDERNEMAWLWLSGAVDTDEARCDCLENVLSINPNNTAAKRGLESLRNTTAHPSTESLKLAPSGNTEKRSYDQLSQPHTAPLTSVATQPEEPPLGNVVRTRSEKVYYSDKSVRVTTSRAIMFGRTYAIAHVTAVGLVRRKPYMGWGISLIMVGFVLLIASIQSGRLDGVVASLAPLIAGGYTVRRRKYVVRFITSAGEMSAMSTPDREYARQVIKALNQAIVERG